MVTQGALSPPLSNSPAFRFGVKLLVKCHRETKEGATVSQLMQCVSGVQVKAADLTQERGESPEEEQPRMRGDR